MLARSLTSPAARGVVSHDWSIGICRAPGAALVRQCAATGLDALGMSSTGTRHPGIRPFGRISFAQQVDSVKRAALRRPLASWEP